MSNNYINNWIYYPWLKNSQQDNLIHTEDLGEIKGLGIAKCIKEDDDFITIKIKNGYCRVKKEGIKRLLPQPKFEWGDYVIKLKRPGIKATIDDFFWHHNKGEYIYYIKVDGKRKSKQFSADELSPAG